MTQKSNRREFLKKASLCVAGGASLGQLFAVGADPVRRVGGPQLKISLNAYSFNTSLIAPPEGDKPTMTLFDVLDFCARHDIEGIDPTGYFFPGYPAVPDDSFIAEFKRRAFQLGIEITGTGVRNDFAQPDKMKRAADVQMVKNWIESAARMSAPVIRVFSGAVPEGYSREQVIEWMVPDLKQCVEHGRKHGVLVGIQNHGDFLLTAAQVLEIVERVDSEWFGVVVDTGNFQHGDDPYAEIARVLPYAVNFQVKESPYGRASDVRTDLKKLARLVRASGYRGYLPIETLVNPGHEYDAHVAVPRLLQELRRAIAETA